MTAPTAEARAVATTMCDQCEDVPVGRRRPECWRCDEIARALDAFAAEAVRKREAEIEASNEALLDKIETLTRGGGTTCACSYEERGDVCMHHSPALMAEKQRADQAEAAVIEAVARERDGCAEVVESTEADTATEVAMLRGIAAAIRSRDDGRAGR